MGGGGTGACRSRRMQSMVWLMQPVRLHCKVYWEHVDCTSTAPCFRKGVWRLVPTVQLRRRSVKYVSWQKQRVLCRLWYWLCRIFHFGETVHKYTVGVSIVQLAAPAFAEYGGMCAVCHKVLDRMRASRRILQRHRMLIKAPLLKALLVYGPCRRVAMVKALLSYCCYAMVKALLLRLVPSFRSAIVPERHGESAALEVKSVALRRGLGRHGGTLFSLRIEGSVCWIACL